MTTPLSPLLNNLAVVKNVVGLLLLLLAASAGCVAAWATDWRLGLAATAVPIGYAGWLLATSEN